MAASASAPGSRSIFANAHATFARPCAFIFGRLARTRVWSVRNASEFMRASSFARVFGSSTPPRRSLATCVATRWIAVAAWMASNAEARSATSARISDASPLDVSAD